jgi:DNA-binding NtrC family response regulator
MTLSNDISVLIVDRSHDWGPDLRARLAPTGVQVHVVNSRAAAVRLASAKKIDVAVLEYAMDQWTQELCAALKDRHVPYVYTTTDQHTDKAINQLAMPAFNGSTRSPDC